MITAEKTKAKIYLNFGEKNGSYTYSGLVPDCDDEQTYETARGINGLQELEAKYILKIVESRLEQND